LARRHNSGSGTVRYYRRMATEATPPRASRAAGTPDGAAAAPAWSRQLIAELQASDQRAIALARGLTVEQLNWKPQPDTWSVGQCLEHLCIAGEVYIPPIASALANQPHSPVETITPGWFGAWFIRSYIAPSPHTKKAPAPRKIRPVLGTVEPAVLDRFLAMNREVRALIERAGPHDVNRIRFANPFVWIIRFTVGTGFEIISKHEQRHLLQAERVWQSWAQRSA
jgi:hypothetical protein